VALLCLELKQCGIALPRAEAMRHCPSKLRGNVALLYEGLDLDAARERTWDGAETRTQPA